MQASKQVLAQQPCRVKASPFGISTENLVCLYPLVKKCVLTQHDNVVTASKTFVRTGVETNFLTKG
jgi:hypothetical protein